MRIEQEIYGVSASTKHLVFAYYVTGHGFGHATRVTEVSSAIHILFGFFRFQPNGCLISRIYPRKILFLFLGFGVLTFQ